MVIILTENNICESMRMMRNEMLWTQRTAARNLGIPRSSYSEYEIGRRHISMELFLRLAELCDCQIILNDKLY